MVEVLLGVAVGVAVGVDVGVGVGVGAGVEVGPGVEVGVGVGVGGTSTTSTRHACTSSNVRKALFFVILAGTSQVLVHISTTSSIWARERSVMTRLAAARSERTWEQRTSITSRTELASTGDAGNTKTLGGGAGHEVEEAEEAEEAEHPVVVGSGRVCRVRAAVRI